MRDPLDIGWPRRVPPSLSMVMVVARVGMVQAWRRLSTAQRIPLDKPWAWAYTVSMILARFPRLTQIVTSDNNCRHNAMR